MWKKLVGTLALMLWVGCSGTQQETISQAFDVDADGPPPTGNCADFTQTIDLTQVDGFNEVKGHLQAASIVSATVTVLNPDTTGTSVATSASGDAAIGVPGTTPTPFATFDTLPLLTQQTETATLANDGSAVLTSAVTTSPYQLNVAGHGCADQYPAHFQLQMDLVADITLKLF